MSHLKNKIKNKLRKYIIRKNRSNKKVKTNNPNFRLIVNKSNLYIKGQVIDHNGNVIAIISDKKSKGKTKTEKAFSAGENMAKLLKNKKIKKITFDRNGFSYHGRVKSFAEGIRKGGIQI